MVKLSHHLDSADHSYMGYFHIVFVSLHKTARSTESSQPCPDLHIVTEYALI
jgi:hypothetical protein